MTMQPQEQIEEEQYTSLAPIWEHKLAHAHEATEEEKKQMSADMNFFTTCAVGEILGITGPTRTNIYHVFDEETADFGNKMDRLVNAGHYDKALDLLREFSKGHDKKQMIEYALAEMEERSYSLVHRNSYIKDLKAELERL